MKNNFQKKIDANNLWYVGDHFNEQFNTAGQKEIIINRWKIFEKNIELWIKNNDINQTISILDAGCGDGINLKFLTNFYSDLKYNLVAFDYSKLRVHRAKKIIENILVTNICEIPFPDETFEIILCNQVIEHIPNDVAAINELRRVLKKNGMLILGVPNEGCKLAYLRNHILQRNILFSTDHVNFYTYIKIIYKLKNLGLVEIYPMQTEGIFYPHQRISIFLRDFRFGRFITFLLNKAFPSQAAGIYLALTKK